VKVPRKELADGCRYAAAEAPWDSNPSCQFTCNYQMLGWFLFTLSSVIKFSPPTDPSGAKVTVDLLSQKWPVTFCNVFNSAFFFFYILSSEEFERL